MKRALKLLLRNLLDTVRYRLVQRGDLPRITGRVVFVCKGNICRSAFAEELMKSQTNDRHISVDSCGLEVTTEERPPSLARSVAAEFGLNLSQHLSRGWQSCDLARADLILAMEYSQFRRLRLLVPGRENHIRLLREFAPFPDNLLCNIADPYGHGKDDFMACFRQIARSVTGLSQRVLPQSGPGRGDP